MSAQGEKGDKTSIDDSAFESLEQDFQQVIQELMGDKSLEKFRVEYEKLHRALKKSHESEKRLMSKCRELNAEIVANSAKVATALKLSQEDQGTIASLKKEIEKAWKMVDAAHEKETRARETIQQLKMEIANLSKLVEQGAGLSLGQDNSVNELLRAKEELTRERDEFLSEVVKLREQVADANSSLQKLENDKTDTAAKITELQQDITVKDNEAQREARKRDKMERDLKQTRQEVEGKSEEVKQLTQQIEKYRADIARSEAQVKEQRISLERAAKETDILQGRLQKVQDDHDTQAAIATDLARQNQERVGEMRRREEDISQLKTEIQKLNKMREVTQRKLRTLEEEKGETDKHRDTLKSQIGSMEKEIELIKRQHEGDKKSIETLEHDKNKLNTSMMKAAAETQKQLNQAKIHLQSKQNLEQEITNYKDEATKQRKLIIQLEKERNRYINEASELTQKVLKHMEEVKVREMQIFDLKKKIAEVDTKLKQQQNLHEAVRSDRNLYSKNLIETRDEVTEMKRKLKIMNHQIDQLKEEISSKDAQLVKEHLERQRVIKEKEAKEKELKRVQHEQSEQKAYIESQAAEERKLMKIISETDAERLRQKKELDQVVAERDILGTQLVRRNDELALLYEKIKIQQSTLNKGEQQYNTRLEDIRVLKLEVRKMRREKGLLQRSVRDIDELKREVYRLQRQLLQERTRCRALEEELENPLNIHRWRRLEGSDPSTFEMIQKIQALQKRLISKTEEIVEKELILQEKEKLYVELKHILARQPGPEVSEQVQIYKQTLKEKTKQMKSMSSELNMYESQIDESRYEIDRLARELHEVKQKYYVQKKKEMQLKDKEALISGKLGAILPQRQDGHKFAGGGFNLKQRPQAVSMS